MNSARLRAVLGFAAVAFATAAGATPEERAAAEAAYFAHNRVAYDHLRERGFF